MLKRFLLMVFVMIMIAPVGLCWRTPRWGYLPVNVYIEDHPKKPIVQRALNTWQNSSGEVVSFRMKNAKLASSLHVQFMDANPKMQRKDFANSVGLASTRSPLGFYNTAVVTIFLKSPIDGSTLTDSELYEISLHEIGHALGLGHSDSRSDIMYPTVHGQTSLSANDLAILKQIYLPD